MMYYYYPPFSSKVPPFNNYSTNNKSTIYPHKYLQSNSNLETRKKEKNSNSFQDNTALFEIFGVKLYFDDILLISLIFLLYSEGVHDQILFITLILLLLS